MARPVIKKMRRVFVDNIREDSILLEGVQHRHFAVVLRARVGDCVEAACGDGFVYDAKVAEIGKDFTLLKIAGKRVDNSESDIACTLFFALQKGDNNEVTVQKAVELGVQRLCPIITRYTVAQRVNLERLSRIALEAAGQCGRNAIPTIDEPISFDKMLKKLGDFDLKIFPYEKATKPSIKDFLRSSIEQFAPVKNAAVIVGAEGGFSHDEVLALGEIGVTPISMGHRILRAETACTAAVCCLMYESENLSRRFCDSSKNCQEGDE